MKKLLVVCAFYLLSILLPISLNAQTIGLNQTVVADFNSIAEFQTLANTGWIFRAGDGVGTQSCATPGNDNVCGFGLATDSSGGQNVARGRAAGNTQGRWIITPPIIFGASGMLRVTLRKAEPGSGGLDIRQSGGGSDTQDMSENRSVPPAVDSIDGACPSNNSFCALQNVRSSGAATSGEQPNCADLFTNANPGIGIDYCTVQINANELRNFGTGVHRLAIKLRSASSTTDSNQDVLVDRIEIMTGNNNQLPEQAIITSSVPATGLYSHPVSGHTAVNLALILGFAISDLSAMDFNPDGNTLYGITSALQLQTINPMTGARTNVAGVTGFLSSNEFVRGLMIDPTSGAASVMTRNSSDGQSRLYDFNLTSGVADLQAGLNAGGAFRASASAIDCQGRLFSVETSQSAGGSARLFRVDRVSGAVTLVGNTAYDSSLFHGPIDFNNRTGQLMGWVQARSGAYIGFGSYNLSTGQFTAISTAPQLVMGAGSISSRCWTAFANGFE